MKTIKTMISVLALSAIAGTAAAGDFDTLDVDANGQVDFQEYKTYAVKNGKSVTLAAQEFTLISQGDASLTEAEFLTADANVTKTLYAGTGLLDAPVALETYETPTPTDVAVDTPLQAKAMESGPFEMEIDIEAEGEIDLEANTDLTSDSGLELPGDADKFEESMSWEEPKPDTLVEPMMSTTGIGVQSEVIGETAAPDTWTPHTWTEEDTTTKSILDSKVEAEFEAKMEDDISVPAAPELPDLSDIN